jgi:hypothetical protein
MIWVAMKLTGIQHRKLQRLSVLLMVNIILGFCCSFCSRDPLGWVIAYDSDDKTVGLEIRIWTWCTLGEGCHVFGRLGTVYVLLVYLHILVTRSLESIIYSQALLSYRICLLWHSCIYGVRTELYIPECWRRTWLSRHSFPSSNLPEVSHPARTRKWQCKSPYQYPTRPRNEVHHTQPKRTVPECFQG